MEVAFFTIFHWPLYTDGCNILIGNANAWLEDFVTNAISHESVHIAIVKLEGHDASRKFDNIFGFVDKNWVLTGVELTSWQHQRLKQTFKFL